MLISPSNEVKVDLWADQNTTMGKEDHKSENVIIGPGSKELRDPFEEHED